MGKVKVDEGGCWLWTGKLKDTGYGEINPGGRSSPRGAHRVSYELFKGEIPKGMYVLHKCDVRCCVNPDHLFLGTAKENTQDMMSKGRGKYTTHSGENNAKSKLTQAEVDEIRRRYGAGESRGSIAKDFNVTPKHITQVAKGRCWKT